MADVAVTKTPAKAFPSVFGFPRWMRRMFPPTFESMMRDMDRFFEPTEMTEGQQMWWPAVECKRKDGLFVVCAELPGLKKEDVKVEVTDDSLIVEGERKHEEKEEKEGYFRSERSYGKFFRQIPLPEGVKAEEIKAEMNNGVLEVKIPIEEPKKPQARQIPVS